MSSRNITDAHSILQKQFLIAQTNFQKANPAVEVFLTSTYRSPQEQTSLFNQPFDKIDNNVNGKIDEPSEKVTNAKAGQSPHNYLPSLAIDVAFNVNGKLDWSAKWFTAFSKYMKTSNISWGGDFKSIPDSPHYELTNFKSYIK